MRWLVLLLALIAAAGCARSTVTRSPDAPGHADRPAAQGATRQVTVQRGDTLYGIAFRHGADWKDVARWNGIKPPYTIFPGQKLRLAASGSNQRQTPARTSAPAASRTPPASGSGVTAPPARTGSRPAPSQPSTRPAPPVVTASKPSAPATSPSPPAVAAGPVRWQWPADGQIVARFAAGDPTRQGIDIAGSAGQAVRAAADGEVVYSGAGLVGYGELIIIKHDDTWLSAYGHNRKRLVSEGQAVQAGQQIAEMGRSGASRDMLHFEIRRSGKPVDPLAQLPRR